MSLPAVPWKNSSSFEPASVAPIPVPETIPGMVPVPHTESNFLQIVYVDPVSSTENLKSGKIVVSGQKPLEGSTASPMTPHMAAQSSTAS